MDAKEGGFFRSDDAGATWVKMSAENRIWGRGWYFGKVTVDPKNADIVYVSNTALYKSTDAGKTWTPIKGAPGGDDYHQLWIYPDDPRRMIVASDQGAVVTVDGAATWSSWYNQSTAQLYHVAADFRFPYWVTGAQQDSGAVGTPVRSPHAEISEHEWTGLGAGGESGYTAPDPLHPDILFGGTVTRWNVVTGASQNISPERGAQGGPFRHAWTQPLVFSQADPRALYFANQYLYKTVNGGESWTQISPDLTREDPGVPPISTRPPRRTPREGAPRRHLHDRALARACPDRLDRHRRRAHPGHGGRRRDVAERDASRHDAVEQGDDDRRLAFRRERSLCRRGAASARGLRAVYLSGRATAAKHGRESRRACPPASIFRR